MTRLQETIKVPRPVAEVFRYTSDFGNIEQWDPGVIESEKLSSAPLQVGTEFRVVVRYGLSSTPMHYVVTVYETPTRVVLEGIGGSIHAVDDIIFTATDTGTEISYSADITLSGPIGRAGPLLDAILRRIGKKAMGGLQAALSQEPNVPTYSLANHVMDRLILPGMFGFTKYGYRCRKRSWQPLAVSLQGKTAVITGATSGLGRATAERLADLGAEVILVGRSEETAQQTRHDLITATGNNKIAVEIADLRLMSEVRKLAKRLLQCYPKIHILINNAAVLINERTTTVEGLETTLATNLVAPFLLTTLLIPTLRASAPSRIINVSSGGMYSAAIDLDDLQSLNRPYNGSKVYAQTKRGLVMLTEFWAKQQQKTGLIIHAMHPGWADTPGVERALPRFYQFTKPLLRTPQEGADTIVWLAAAPEAGNVSGRFWLDREPHITAVLPGTYSGWTQQHQLWKALSELSSKSS